MKISTSNYYFKDPEEYDPPQMSKVLLLTDTGTCVIGCWGEGCIGWLELPRIPIELKAKIKGGEGDMR
jgi:hypothetical protein